MKSVIYQVVSIVVLTFIFMGFRYLMGFENAVLWALASIYIGTNKQK